MTINYKMFQVSAHQIHAVWTTPSEQLFWGWYCCLPR